jgi:hypothetical protein
LRVVPNSETGSLVAIAPTGKHSPRAVEVAGNSVLQLDLGVRDMAEVIHGFKNPAVNRWSPGDWLGSSELRFWFYSNNRQTALFAEILDNRGPCPDPSGVEIYSYQFIDDFSSWKQIIDPFNDNFEIRKPGLGLVTPGPERVALRV